MWSVSCKKLSSNMNLFNFRKQSILDPLSVKSTPSCLPSFLKEPFWQQNHLLYVNVTFPTLTNWWNVEMVTNVKWLTVWKVSKYGVFSGPYYPELGLNTEIYRVKLHIQSECEKIRARKNSVYGHFSRCGSLLSETLTNQKFGVFNVFLVSQLFVILWTWHFHKILRGDFIFIFFCSNKPNGVFWVSIK